MEEINKILTANCCGCQMCGDICPVKAIEFQYGADGFWYPKIDESACMRCKQCISSCPVLNPVLADNNIGGFGCFASLSASEKTRNLSTSGGLMREFMNRWLETRKNPFVYGAIYESNCSRIVHRGINRNPDISKAMQSKYAQSHCLGVYDEISRRLDKGQSVLFCGCPCQVAGLKSYIHTDCENLLTVDFFCTGICSPVMYEFYLKDLEHKFDSQVESVWFKNKESGWREVSVKVSFQNGKVYYKEGILDSFMVAFVEESLILRSSCFACPYRNLKHASDLTVCDFWGIEKILPEIDDDKGISGLMINTKEGLNLVNNTKESIKLYPVKLDDIVSNNRAALYPMKKNENQEAFIASVPRVGFTKALKRYWSRTFVHNARIKYRVAKSHFKRMLKGLLSNR